MSYRIGQCASSGSCGYGFSTIAKEKDLAVKTGTAEVGSVQDDTSNSLAVGFAPSNNPTVSFVCVAPTSSTGRLQSNICTEMGYKALVEYYKTYE